MKQGNKPFKFGSVERKASLNWASLGTSLAVAILTWTSQEFIPELESNYEGAIAVIAGLTAQVIPMIVLYLRNNKDLKVEEKTDGEA